MRASHQPYHAVLIGGSAGAMNVLKKILPAIENDFPLPIIIVLHLHPSSQGDYHIESLDKKCALPVEEAKPHEPIRSGHIYFAAANYHLLIENERIFSFSIDPKVNYCRPSIDVTFESAVDAYGKKLIGVILSGANNDGAQGLKALHLNGGVTIVQVPDTAESEFMPKAAINETTVDYIVGPEEIAPLLAALTQKAKP